MNTGYVFYCSKCKVDHAGECPPEKVTVQVTPKFVFISGHVPQPGSVWVVQDSNNGGPWVDRYDPIFYEVVQVTHDSVKVREAGIANAGATPFGLEHDWWGDDGHVDATHMGLSKAHRVRMVPRP